MSVLPVPGLTLGCSNSLPGTLAFFARFTKSGPPYAVTCSHNLAPNWAEVVEKPSVDLKDRGDVHVPSSSLSSEATVGQMIWAKALRPALRIDYDCALARMTKTCLNMVDGKPVSELWKSETLPDSVVLVAGETLLPGNLSSQSRMSGWLSVPLRTDGPFYYDNLFEVVYKKPSEGGMSGAPVLAANGQLVGMHVGAFEKRSYFHRADQILNWLGMTLYLA